MNIKEEAAELARVFQSSSWDWKLRSVLAALAPLEPAPAGSAVGASHFDTRRGVPLTVYHEGERVEGVEFTLDIFHDPECLSESEYEDKVDEFFAKYGQAVEGAKLALGMPEFDNGAAAKGFPEDQDAVWLALWKRDGARFMVQQKHEDKELPFRVCVVIIP